MADENKPDNSDDVDDLLSDFNDLFPEEDDNESHESGANEELDDLDSLLEGLDEPIESSPGSEKDSAEDTESNLDSLLDGLEEQVGEIAGDGSEAKEDDLDNMLDEMMADTQPAAERDLDIANDELDLSVESAQPDADEENALNELISSNEDKLLDDELEMELDAKMAEAATATTPADEPSFDTLPTMAARESKSVAKPASKLAGMVIYLILVIALGLSGGSIWMTLQAQQAADNNSVKLNKILKQQDRTQRNLSDTPYNPLVEQNSSAIRDLDLRISELSTMVEKPLSHMGANSSEEVIGKLEERLQQLEQNLVKVKEELAKRPTVVATTTAPPLLIKAPESSAKVEKLWALNLLSLTIRKGATDAVKRLKDAGVDASTNRFTAKDGRTWYRVRITGFSSYEAAKAYSRKMPKVRGISKAWVTAE